MEILMKLKCSPSVPNHGNSTTHSTLKVVDHHHQLTQQHATLPAPVTTTPPTLIRLPSQTNVTYGSPPSLPTIAIQTLPSVPSKRPCLNYSKSLECCNITATQQGIEIFSLPWDQQGRRNVTYEVSMQKPPSCCSDINASNLYETPACCSTYGTVSTASHSTGTPQLAQLPPLQQAPTMHPPPLSFQIASSEDLSENDSMADLDTHYEYKEPEENFISIEDTKIKGFLVKIGRECALQKRRQKPRDRVIEYVHKSPENQVDFEIIDLDDEDDREELRQIMHQVEKNTLKKDVQRDVQHIAMSDLNMSTKSRDKCRARLKSPCISLIPKSPPLTSKSAKVIPQQKIELSKERIIAHIELSDTSDSEPEQCENITENIRSTESAVAVVGFNSDDDEDELSFAAAAVTCELECDDDDIDNIEKNSDIAKTSTNISSNEVVVLHSDDENFESIDKPEKGQELNWEDIDRREKGRQFFECYLCGKKVQSSYNLRRHMMIHTGERPFGCDMCDRRFREFSDLKKHRRRHSNETNFVCMVCRVKPPMIQDSTRCNDCDSKTSAITAAMRPQLSASPSLPDTPQTPSLPMPTLPPPPLTARPSLSTDRFHDTSTITSYTLIENSAETSNKETPKTIGKITLDLEDSTSSPKRSSSTPLPSADMPSLVPINAPFTVNKTAPTSTQLLLDNIPVVHRPNYNQLGIVTRKEFPCPLCQRPFGTRHNLKRHFMIHTGEKPFSCNKCRKPFREYSTLKKHMATHQRDRYYKCLHCPRKYRDYLEYSGHKKTHTNEEDDDDDDDMNFDQQQLSSSSTTSSPQKKVKISCDSSYDSNEEDSSSEDWLECCECKQRFTEIELYTKHLKEHDPMVYLYECYICKKTFEQRDELIEHVSACKEELRETALQRAKCFN
uniref:Zinc finger protein Xfin n=2 Tax=Bactrocera latifrons TaxID=174628 RepID=A0A0K8UKU0_BACLA